MNNCKTKIGTESNRLNLKTDQNPTFNVLYIPHSLNSIYQSLFVIDLKWLPRFDHVISVMWYIMQIISKSRTVNYKICFSHTFSKFHTPFFSMTEVPIFDGNIRHFSEKPGGLKVDDFYGDTVANYFISHAHADHFKGLHEFQNRSNDSVIYCTEETGELIMNWPGYEREILSNKFRYKSVGDRFSLRHRDGVSNTTVEFARANHIPGAVMMLFEDKDYKALYTGDFRFESYERSEVANEMKSFLENTTGIDFLYLDITCLDLLGERKGDRNKFPCKRIILEEIADMVSTLTESSDLPERVNDEYEYNGEVGFEGEGFEGEGFEYEGFENEGFEYEGFESEGFEGEGFENEGFEYEGFESGGVGGPDSYENVHVDCSVLGWQEVAKHLAVQFDSSLGVCPRDPKKKLHECIIGLLPGDVKIDKPHNSFVHISNGSRCRYCTDRTLRIRPSLKWLFYDMEGYSYKKSTWIREKDPVEEPGFFNVLYSLHSSHYELQQFMKLLNFRSRILWRLIWDKCIHPLVPLLNILGSPNFAGTLLITIQIDSRSFRDVLDMFLDMFLKCSFIFVHSMNQEHSRTFLKTLLTSSKL